MLWIAACEANLVILHRAPLCYSDPFIFPQRLCLLWSGIERYQIIHILFESSEKKKISCSLLTFLYMSDAFELRLVWLPPQKIMISSPSPRVDDRASDAVDKVESLEGPSFAHGVSRAGG